MSEITQAWIEELEARYGVHPLFSRRLAPLLDCLASQSLGESQRTALFQAIAAAYRSTGAAAPGADPERPRFEEVRLLVAQFIGEVRKMEESLKVLGAVLQRARAQLEPPGAPRILH